MNDLLGFLNKEQLHQPHCSEDILIHTVSILSVQHILSEFISKPGNYNQNRYIWILCRLSTDKFCECMKEASTEQKEKQKDTVFSFTHPSPPPWS